MRSIATGSRRGGGGPLIVAWLAYVGLDREDWTDSASRVVQ